MKRVTFYFDGFNFYNGLKTKATHDPSWKQFYWLDFVQFCNQFVNSDQKIAKVKYFTSPPLNSNKKSRQAALLSANQLINPDTFEVINGKYYTKNVSCKLCNQIFQQPEEKRTDVNISNHLLMDCFEDLTDKLVLISADTDLISTLTLIKTKFPEKQLKVYFPPLRTSSELLKAFKPVVYLENNKSKFENSILDEVVSLSGQTYIRPENWV